MTDTRSFQRFAAVVAIIGFFTAMTSNVLQGIPVQFSLDITSNPSLFLKVGATGVSLIRWGLILDMLGYYLPFLPIALFLGYWFKTRNPLWSRFFTVCGVGYIFIGAVGAVTIAVVQPHLATAYAQAASDQRAMLEMLFGVIWSIIYKGLWNILGELLVGIWFLGIGILLQHERRALGVVSMIVGASAFLDFLGNILTVDSVALLGLSIFLLLAPIWALWIGIDLLRKPVQFVDGMNPISHAPIARPAH